jgi:hypothetical protein
VVGANVIHGDFDYSDAMRAKGAEGMTWTFENLDHFIENPKGFIPGTAMGYAGVKTPEERADIIAYLRTLRTPGTAPQPPAPTAEAPPRPAEHRPAPTPARTSRRGAGSPAPAEQSAELPPMLPRRPFRWRAGGTGPAKPRRIRWRVRRRPAVPSRPSQAGACRGASPDGAPAEAPHGSPGAIRDFRFMRLRRLCAGGAFYSADGVGGLTSARAALLPFIAGETPHCGRSEEKSDVRRCTAFAAASALAAFCQARRRKRRGGWRHATSLRISSRSTRLTSLRPCLDAPKGGIVRMSDIGTFDR